LAQWQFPSERRWLSSPEETALARDPEIVREMFDRVTRRYDLANHLLSFGRDFSWRRRAAEIVAGWNPACVLDLATGSGDLALVIQRKLSTVQVVGLDFSLPQHPIWRFLHRCYLHRIMPFASALIADERKAYQYLGASIENFPSGAAMCDLIEANGFKNAVAEPLTGGIVTIYTAQS